jgi:hypothetical protein
LTSILILTGYYRVDFTCHSDYPTEHPEKANNDDEQRRRRRDSMEVIVPSSMLNPWLLSTIFFLGYWVLCRILRWRRAAFIANKFKGRDPYSLNVDEAQWIVEQIVQLEMSKISRLSTAFALFRTYGITTIAELLLKYTSPSPYPSFSPLLEFL